MKLRKEKLAFLETTLKVVECKLMMLKQRQVDLLQELTDFVEGHHLELLHKREELLQKAENFKKRVQK